MRGHIASGAIIAMAFAQVSRTLDSAEYRTHDPLCCPVWRSAGSHAAHLGSLCLVPPDGWRVNHLPGQDTSGISCIAESGRTLYQGGACGAAGPALAPGSAFPEARPAHAGLISQGTQIRLAHTPCRPVPGTAVFLDGPLSRSRPPRIGRPCGRRCAIGYART